MAKDLAVGTTSELDEIVDISADEEFFSARLGKPGATWRIRTIIW